MNETTPVSPERYSELMAKHAHEIYHLDIQAWRVPLIHGLIALAAEHPGIQATGEPTQSTIRRVRGLCRLTFRRWGFTAAEARWLDRARIAEDGSVEVEK